MKRREFLKKIGAGAAAFYIAGCANRRESGSTGQSAQRRPNIILVLTDDQGYGDLGCMGNKILRTPNIDQFYNESTRFTRFQVSPSCSPTRAAILTGKHEFRTGVTSTTFGRYNMAQCATLADTLSRAGYETAMFGKWHLGENYPFRPGDRGFKESFWHGGGGISQTPDYWGNTYFDATYNHNGKFEKSKGFCTDVFFDAAFKFMEKNRGQPFFVYLPLNAPHYPYTAPESYAKPYEEMGLTKEMANFYGMITNIDDNIARLTQKVRQLGIEEDTLIIFMTDNGSVVGDQKIFGGLYNAGMRGRKGQSWEGGTRVPCFWRWPGKLKAGVDIDRVAAHTDLMPTILELCGIPADDLKFDGKSLVSLLENPQANWDDRFIFIHLGQWPPGANPQDYKYVMCAVRSQKFRLVNNSELHDIENDPGETQNVIEQYPELVAEMRAAYDKWWEQMLPTITQPVAIQLGSPSQKRTRLSCMEWWPTITGNQQISDYLGQQMRIRKIADYFIESREHAEIKSYMGSWPVDVTRAGKYKLTLRIPPEEAKEKVRLKPGEAHILCGSTNVSAPIPAGAGTVTIEAELQKGPARLECWFANQLPENKPIGALFVDVEYAG